MTLTTNNNSNIYLNVHGSGEITVNKAIVTSSDRTLKKNITTLENSLDKINMLRGVNFDWKDESRNIKGKQKVGFIAQEIEVVIPELVNVDDDVKSVNYSGMTAVLVEAMKEQQKMIKALQDEVAALKENIN